MGYYFTIIIYYALIVECTIGIYFSIKYYIKSKNTSLYYSTLCGIFGILVIIGRLLLFHPIATIRNYGIQTIPLWMACTMGALLLLIITLTRSKYSLNDMIFIFGLIGALFMVAILNAWKEIEVAPGFFTYSPSNSAMVLLLGVQAIFVTYVVLRISWYLNSIKQFMTKSIQQTQINLIIISCITWIPLIVMLQFFISCGLITFGSSTLFINYLNGSLIFTAFGIILSGLFIIGKFRILKPNKIHSLIIASTGGIPLYHYNFHQDDFPVDNSMLTAALMSVSIFFRHLMRTNSQIKEVVFDDIIFLCKFQPPRIDENIPAYACVLLVKEKSIFIVQAFKQFADRFDSKFRNRFRQIEENKISPIGIDNFVNDLFIFP
jgi:hypothetical protein